MPLDWDDPITENPALNATEIWELHNFTGTPTRSTSTRCSSRSLDREHSAVRRGRRSAGRRGTKDTVIAYPGEITRVKAKFDLAGLSSGTATSSSTRTTR